MSTIKAERPRPARKPAHLHSLSVRARPSGSGTRRPVILPVDGDDDDDEEDRGLDGLRNKGLVQHRLNQLGTARKSPIDSGLLWASSEDERELEVDEARWEAERQVVRLERARRRAEAEAAVKARQTAASTPREGNGSTLKADNVELEALLPPYHAWSLLRGRGPSHSIRRRRDASGARADDDGSGRSTLKVAKPRTRKISGQRAMAIEMLFNGVKTEDDAHVSTPRKSPAGSRASTNKPATPKEGPPTITLEPAPVEALAGARRLSTLSFLTAPLLAVALHNFEPSSLPVEAVSAGATPELGFDAGQDLVILVEDVGGGWSLGHCSKHEGEDVEPRVGLIPRGWYQFAEDASKTMTAPDPEAASPNGTAAPNPDAAEAKTWTNSPLAAVLPPQMLKELSANASPAANELRPPRANLQPPVSVRASDAFTFWHATLGASATAKLRDRLDKATSRAVAKPDASVDAPTQAPKESPPVVARSRQVSVAAGIGAWFTGRGKQDAAAKSGARSYIVEGDTSDTDDPADDADDEAEGVDGGRPSKAKERFEVDEGPTWRVRVPLFAVQVHSPSTRIDDRKREHTVFSVTSTSWSREADTDQDEMTQVTVERRYSQFERLGQVLAARYSGIVLPSLPEKQFAGRFGAVFLETRRRGLERYLTRLIRHPLLRHAEPLIAFLSLDDDVAHDALFAAWSADPPSPGDFFAKVWHPEWNVQRDEAVRELQRCAKHVRAVEAGGGVADIEHAVARVRSTMQDLSDQLSGLSRAVLRLTAGMSLPPSTPRLDGADEDEDEEGDYDPPDALGAMRKRARAEAMQTTDGAWCWREECLAMTKALQATGVSLQAVAELYRHCSEEGLAPLQELVKECSNPQRQHKHLFDLHRATLQESAAEETAEVEARRDTVLNVTMSEIERYHTERNEDFCDIAERVLDEQLDLHQRAYDRLKTCRHLFSDSNYPDLAASGRREPNSEELALLSCPTGHASGSILGSWTTGPLSPATSYAGSTTSRLWTRAMPGSVPGLRDLFG